RLPNSYQPYYLAVANDIQNAIKPLSKCVIVIRKENIKHPRSYSSSQGADFIEIAFVDQEGKVEKIQNTVSVAMPSVEDSISNEMIKKRVAIAKELDLEERLKNEPTKDLGQVTSEINKDWHMIEIITRFITRTYFREKLARLANGNCRLIFVIYHKFLEYLLLKKKIDGTLSWPTPKRDRVFESRFYSWLVEYGEAVGLRLFNLVELTEQWYEKWGEIGKKRKKGVIIKKGVMLGCFLEYLILVYLYNRKKDIESRGHKYHYTPFREILEAFRPLGFSEKRIKETIINLWSGESDTFGHMIDIIRGFRDKEPKIDNLKAEDRIWLLPRGEMACLETTHKYTYIIEQIYNGEEKVNLIEITEEHILADLDLLCKVANMHLESLLEIRRNLSQTTWFTPTKWLQDYKKKFSIDMTLQLTRIINYHLLHLTAYLDDESVLLARAERSLEQEKRQLNDKRVKKKTEKIKEDRESLNKIYHKIGLLKNLRYRYNREVENIIKREKYNHITFDRFFPRNGYLK
ncbi:MAG: hypothetical protein ACFE96_19200, partial [Candidatus Hermodarchaeota archaeon]